MNVDGPATADEDAWLDEDVPDSIASQQIASREWTALASRFTDAGYRDGIGAGKQATVQAGFNQGFSSTGAPLGCRLGFMRGSAAALLVYLTTSSSASTTSISITTPSSIDNHQIDSTDTTTDQASSSSAILIEQTRELVRRLGRIKLVDIAPVDVEAEQHAREHGEEISLPLELQDKRELESLEEQMQGLSGGGGDAVQKPASSGKKQELDECQSILDDLLEKAGLGKLTAP